MSEATTIGTQLSAAVHQSIPLSRTGVLERLFSRLFEGLVYAQIWEDPVADMEALDLGPQDDMVCIASGGCNVMSYLTANPRSVTAVDLSPAHIALLNLKLAAVQHLSQSEFFDLFGRADRKSNTKLFRKLTLALDPVTKAWWEARVMGRRRASMLSRNFYAFGALGRFICATHLVSRLGGVNFTPLLEARDMEAQRAFFEDRISPLFDQGPIRWLARRRASLFGLGIPPAQYDKLAKDGGGDVIPVLRERVRKLMCDFPISENYFAWAAFNQAYPADARTVPPYLEAAQFNTVRANAGCVRPLNRSLTDVLAEAPDASKSVYVLLDAQDWMTDAQLTALWTEITRTARPGARVLFRTGGTRDILPGRVTEPLLSQWDYDARASATAFANDRSAIYGGVHLYRFRGAEAQSDD